MTREEAANELQSYADSSWGGLNKAFEMAISALREQESAKKAHCNSWISVDEALPPDQSDVLVVVLWNGEWQTMTGWLSCVTRDWRCVTPYGEHKPEKVTHWMPLPDAPEVEV